ncbi:hepcidin-1-like [Bufo bufo]|uniref:hepcidin-1-like n=1 Tax=Bufo bufo TaxID=8384 RepID=UPI001ABE687B|nr:hepcidin-1-like [Bufo bufo]
MKSLTLCLILVLALLFQQGLGASVRGSEIMNSGDRLALSQTEASEVQGSAVRSRRHIGGLSFCMYCCKCCRNKGCGYCCRT